MLFGYFSEDFELLKTYVLNNHNNVIFVDMVENYEIYVKNVYINSFTIKPKTIALFNMDNLKDSDIKKILANKKINNIDIVIMIKQERIIKYFKKEIDIINVNMYKKDICTKKINDFFFYKDIEYEKKIIDNMLQYFMENNFYIVEKTLYLLDIVTFNKKRISNNDFLFIKDKIVLNIFEKIDTLFLNPLNILKFDEKIDHQFNLLFIAKIRNDVKNAICIKSGENVNYFLKKKCLWLLDKDILYYAYVMDFLCKTEYILKTSNIDANVLLDYLCANIFSFD